MKGTDFTLLAALYARDDERRVWNYIKAGGDMRLCRRVIKINRSDKVLKKLLLLEISNERN